MLQLSSNALRRQGEGEPTVMEGNGTDATPEPGTRTRRDYELPELTVLGSLTELTQGIVPTGTDGVLPGSLFEAPAP